jgi:hypothetical protein
MSTASEQQHDALRQQIDDSLQKASTHKDKLKRANSRYSITNIILGALATFAAGQAAILGKPMVAGWRITCAVASGLALGATVVAGVQKQLVDAEQVAKASECTAKLRALRVEMLNPTYDREEVRRKYQQILAEFTEVPC